MSDTVKVPLWEGRAEARVTPCDEMQLVQVCVTYDTLTGGGATLTLYASPAECRALADTLAKAGAHVLHRGAPQVADAAVDEPVSEPETRWCQQPMCDELAERTLGVGGRHVLVCSGHTRWGWDQINRCAFEAGRVAGLKAAHAAMVDAVEDANAALRALEEMGA